MIDYREFLDQILKGYKKNYDIVMHDDVEEGLVAEAHMHITEMQCVVFKEFSLWTANADEYVYFYRIPHLTEEIARKVINDCYEDGMPKIDLDNVNIKHQHMRTHFVALFICDTADKEAVKCIKKCKIYKSFQFSLKGWMEMHTDLITLGDEKVYTNRYGTKTAEYLKIHVKHYKKERA
ncbi:MAG: hypothetical protein K6B28_10410 [Lachnospiraceae bacterium]|nr:hypothetical protein [Lachnospiraceae bacterium]